MASLDIIGILLIWLSLNSILMHPDMLIILNTCQAFVSMTLPWFRRCQYAALAPKLGFETGYGATVRGRLMCRGAM